MKKFIGLFLFISMIFLFFGCVNFEEEFKENIQPNEIKLNENEDKEEVNQVIIEEENEFEMLEDEMIEILKQFDLNDSKEFWSGNINDDFRNDMVIITLRRSWVYPTLEIKNFGLENIKNMEFLDVSSNGNYRLLVFITLKEHGKEKVVEAIKYLEKLEFIKYVEPSHIFKPNF